MSMRDVWVGALGAAALMGTACSGGDSGGGGANAALSYYTDAKPILDAKCVNCHVQGGIAPFALETYEEVRAQKSAIVAAVTSGSMPPWPPSDECNTYLGDRSLTAAQRETLTKWIEQGAAEGDAKAAGAPIEAETQKLSRIDRTLTMPVAYTPQILPDDYRCFLVDWPDTKTTYVTGFGVQPGTPAIVHHVIAYLATPDKVADYQALDDADPGPGYTCFGGPGNNRAAWIGGWAPGALGADTPEGTGIEIPPGSKVVIQVHYNTSTTAPVADQTSVLLKLDESVEKRAFVLPYANPAWLAGSMTIPAHSMDTMHTYSADPSLFVSILSGGAVSAGQPLTIWEAGLHMHTRGTHATTAIQRASGDKECLLDIPSWDFHWQGSYALRKPTTLEPGDRISLECHWNNSGSTDVSWGEGTNDEMCLGTYYITQ
jgi:hypothetical protein